MYSLLMPQVEYSKSLKEWIESREYFTTNDRTRGYSTLLRVWGDRSNITSIAKKIVEYEDKRKKYYIILRVITCALFFSKTY